MAKGPPLSNFQVLTLILLAAVLVVPSVFSNSLTSDGYILVKNTALMLLGAAAILAIILGISGNWFQFPRRLIAPIVILPLSLIASIPATSSPGISLNEFLRVCALLAIFAVATCVASSRHAKTVAYAAILVASCISVLGIINFLTGAIFPAIHDSYGFEMFGATLGHDNFAGQYLITVIPLGLALGFGAIEKGRRVATWLLLAACCVMLVFLSITFSRGAWAGLGASIVVFAVVLWRRSRLLSRNAVSQTAGLTKRLTGAAFVAILIAAAALSFSLSKRESGTSAIQKAEKAIDMSDAPIAFRLKLWQGSLSLVRQHPAFGVGCGAFALYYPSVRLAQEHRIAGAGISVRSPHNDYIRLAVETGFLGLTAFIYLLGASIWPLLKRPRNKASPNGIPMVALGGAGAVAATLVHAFFSSNLTMPASSTMFAINLGLVAGCLSAKESGALIVSKPTKAVAAVVLAAIGVLLIVRPVSLLAADYKLRQARTLIARGNNAGAIEELQKSIFFAGYYLEPRILLGNLYLLNQQFQQAIDVLKPAAELSPFWPQIQNNIGVAYLQRASHKKDPGSLMDAYLAFSRAVKLDPEFQRAWLNLGGTLDSLGRNKEAQKAYQRALELFPDDVVASSKLAQALMADNQPEAAQKVLERALVQNPKNANLLNNLGTVLVAQGKEDDAISAFKSAVSVSGGLFQPHLNLARLYEKRSEIDKAIRQYKMALEIKPDLEVAADALKRLVKAQ
ncbi:MAG TPA: tetratricopeptide repeat protein [bacterium]|nr:tetratricopeptide repeat protein [bacterium]